jgi:acyl transferase domain-containing protein
MVLGHGVDKIVTACVAGVMSMEDAMKLVVMRGRLMQSLSHNEGVMFAARCTPSEVRDVSGTLTEEHASSVSLAAANGPRRVVVSGPEGSVRAVLTAFGVEGYRMNVSHGFHSPLMQPMEDA